MRKKARYNTPNTIFFTFRMIWKKDPASILFYAAHTIFNLAFSILSVYLLPTVIALIEKKADIKQVLVIVTVFVIGILFARLCSTLMSQLYWPRMSNVRLKLSQELDELMLSMPYDLFEDPVEQNSYKNANNVINTTQEGLAGTIITSLAIVDEIVSFVIFSAISLTINYLLFLIIFISAIISFFYANRINKTNYENKKQSSLYDRETNWLQKAMIDDTYGKDIRMYQMEPWFQNRIERAFNEKISLYKKTLRNNQKLSVLNLLMKLVCDIAIYALLIYQVLANFLSVSEFSLQFSIVHKINGLFSNIMKYVVRLQKYNLAINDYRSVVERKKDYQDEYEGEEICTDKVTIEFKNVSFQYPNTNVYILKNLSFSIQPGEKIALVGENGAGKSTIVKLICRLYKPSEGFIFVNGKDIWGYSEKSYRSLLSVVFQDTVIYGFTVAENVSMKKISDTDMEKVEHSLKQAGLLEKINSFPEGCNSKLVRKLYDDAVALSGGEQQKLAIARAFYKDAPIMILDEPTAALDAFVESRIYQSFHEMTNGKTTVFISHRLASAKFCDKIILLKNGEIEDMGTHEKLVLTNDLYRELYQIQANGYTTEEI